MSYRGVTAHGEKWQARIGDPKKLIGTYDAEEDAARAYDAEAVKLYGDKARLNFPGPSDFKIDPEIQALLPAPAPDEMAGLRALIKQSRHVDALVVLVVGEGEGEPQRVLGDGHNRLVICREEGIPYATREVAVPDRESAIQWVIDNQLARRNLTDERKAYYIGKEYLNKKKTHGGDRKSEEGSSSQNGDLIGKTTEAVAEKHGVSPRTVQRDAEFAAAVDEIAAADQEAKEAILSGASGKTKQEVVETVKPKILCERCQRVAPGKGLPDCPGCAAARADAEKKKKQAAARKKKKAAPREDVKDKTGAVVPDSCRDAFADATLPDLIAELEAVEVMLTAERWTGRAEKLTPHYPFILITKVKEHAWDALQSLQLALEALRAGVPHAVCPKCQGVDSTSNGKTCRTCRGCGHIPEHRYLELQREPA